MSNYNVSYIFTAIDKFTPALSRISAQVNETRDKMSGFKSSLKVIGGQFKDTGEALTKYVTAPLMAAGAAALFEANKYDNMALSLKYLTGNAGKAKAMFDSMLELEGRTPFDLEGLIGAAKSLSAYGMAAKNIEPTIMKLGDVAAGSGAGIDELARAYGRVAMRGRMSSREMMMFTQMQIPLIKTIAEQMKLPQTAVAQMAQKGMISAAMVDRALQSMTAAGGRYHGAMADKMNTIGVATAKLKDSLEMMAAGLGRIIQQAIPVVPLMQSAAQYIEALTARMKDFAAAHPIMTKMLVWAALFAAALFPVIAAVGGLMVGIGTIANSVAGFTTAMAAIMPLMSGMGAAMIPVAAPILAVAAAVLAMGNALRLVWKYKDTLKSVFSMEGAKDVLNYVTGNQPQYLGPQNGQALAAHSGPGAAVRQAGSNSTWAGNLQISVPRGVTAKMTGKSSGPANFDTGLNMAGAY